MASWFKMRRPNWEIVPIFRPQQLTISPLAIGSLDVSPRGLVVLCVAHLSDNNDEGGAVFVQGIGIKGG
jgi:hypothetical protein